MNFTHKLSKTQEKEVKTNYFLLICNIKIYLPYTQNETRLSTDSVNRKGRFSDCSEERY